MNLILLSGGSGKRLWPLSNEIRSKQFIRLFRNHDGCYESMVQRVYRQIQRVDPDATVTVACSKAQVSSLLNQLGSAVGISVEPCRRDTFPAIALAAAYLHEHRQLAMDESVIICPVDPYVEDDYFHALKEMAALSDQGDANLVLMGITPTCPSEKYGYIIPKTGERVSTVSRFTEKPDQQTAQRYLSQGALWNGGVFACKLRYLLEQAHRHIDFVDYQDLYNQYASLERVSFDYAVAEQEQRIQVLRFSGKWNDLGTWNNLTDVMEDACIGQALLNDSCENVHVLNEIGVPILAMGLHNVVISASPNGILVADKEQSTQIKPYVDGINQQIMFAEKSWGSFRVLDVDEGSLTIKVTLNPGNRMNYHSHKHRDETWIVISGTGYVIVDDISRDIRPGEVITMAAGLRHSVVATTRLQLIEVQQGPDISVHDKEKFPFPEVRQ